MLFPMYTVPAEMILGMRKVEPHEELKAEAGCLNVSQRENAYGNRQVRESTAPSDNSGRQIPLKAFQIETREGRAV